MFTDLYLVHDTPELHSQLVVQGCLLLLDSVRLQESDSLQVLAVLLQVAVGLLLQNFVRSQQFGDLVHNVGPSGVHGRLSAEDGGQTGGGCDWQGWARRTWLRHSH